MTKLMTVFFALAAFTAFTHSAVANGLQPRTLGQVCDRIQTDADTARCMAASRGLYIDPIAAAACDRFTGVEDTINCVTTIAGLSFEPDSVYVCDRITTTVETLDCLAGSGRPVGGSHGNARSLRRAVSDAIAAVQANRNAEALNILYGMQDELNQRSAKRSDEKLSQAKE